MERRHTAIMSVLKKKLIEVALPLEAINLAGMSEKSRGTGTIRNIHKWFAPMPGPVWRVLLAASLIDDPEDDQKRAELLEQLSKLVPADGGYPSQDAVELVKKLLGSQANLLDETVVLDPFCGGGSTLLEAQRLGFNTVASDLNPVPTLITRVTTQLLAKVRENYSAKNPDVLGSDWKQFFTAEILKWAAVVRAASLKELSGIYPESKNGTAIAWWWAHSVPCPNPACRLIVPIYSSALISDQPGDEAWLKSVIDGDELRFEVTSKKSEATAPTKVPGSKAIFACVRCGTNFGADYIKLNKGSRTITPLVTTFLNGNKRTYLGTHQDSSTIVDNFPAAELDETPLPKAGLGLRIQPYGFVNYEDIFTKRQAKALSVFSDQVRALTNNSEFSEMDNDLQKAVISFLALCIGKLAHFNSTQTRWRTVKGGSKPEAGFGLATLSMIWDFAEVNPFGGSVGDWNQVVSSALRALESIPNSKATGIVLNGPAQDVKNRIPKGNYLVATDPPYFDAIGYADLSDYFYIWHRRVLSGVFPDLYSTIGVPRAPELVADKSRHDESTDKATQFFIKGFKDTFAGIAEISSADLPILIVYAHQHKTIKDGDFGSTGWEALLQALFEAKLQITASWPIHCTSNSRLRGIDSNALSTYVLLTCRHRVEELPSVDRRSFVKQLKIELPEVLIAMQSAGVTPLDLAQASIGPGMAVFTRHTSIFESDGSIMSVRTALGLIRQIVDEILEDQLSDLDSVSRFCVKWFSEYGWDAKVSGDADQLARATNTSISELTRGGVFEAVAGKARLLAPDEMPSNWNPELDKSISIWEVTMQIAHAVSNVGIDFASELLAKSSQKIDTQTVKELSYLLYSISEKRGLMESAILFNGLGTSWNSLKQVKTVTNSPSSQDELIFTVPNNDETEEE
jgi:putative DNA methylase